MLYQIAYKKYDGGYRSYIAFNTENEDWPLLIGEGRGGRSDNAGSVTPTMALRPIFQRMMKEMGVQWLIDLLKSLGQDDKLTLEMVTEGYRRANGSEIREFIPKS